MSLPPTSLPRSRFHSGHVHGRFSPSPSPSPSPSSTTSTSRPPSFPPTNSTSHHPTSSLKWSTGMVVGIAMGGVLVAVVLTLIFFLYKKKRQRDDEAPPTPSPKDEGSYSEQHQQDDSRTLDDVVTSLPPLRPPSPTVAMSSSGFLETNYSDHPAPPPSSPGLGIYQNTYNYEELATATDGFSEANFLGQGGFGYVYKGILPNGKEVAVKYMKAESVQGDREFMAEIGIISRVHYKHLVSLIGYCVAGAQRLLVYEFLPNNTLEFHLHGKGQPPMGWSLRLKIAVGSAKGLAYLHETCYPKIIHRDIKAANILIDAKFEAKVADFGLAKIASETNTHVSTRVMGTFGYLAPEYAASGKLTEKSDVYSFGVVLLELITGRRPVDANNDYGDSFVDWARPLLTRALERHNFEELVDTKLNNEYDKEEMTRMVACAGACVRHSARRRPRMDQVERALEGNVPMTDPNEEIRPGHSNEYNSYGESTDYDMNQDNEDMNILSQKKKSK